MAVGRRLALDEQAVVGLGVLRDFIDGGDAVEDFEPAVAAEGAHALLPLRICMIFQLLTRSWASWRISLVVDHQLVDA